MGLRKKCDVGFLYRDSPGRDQAHPRDGQALLDGRVGGRSRGVQSLFGKLAIASLPKLSSNLENSRVCRNREFADISAAIGGGTPF